MRADGAPGAVVASSGIVTAFSTPGSGLVSLGVGLIGVCLARWVFVGRENRQLGKPQRWNDTLPLTLVAMLVTGVIVYDRKMGLSMSAFTGLGVGWAAVLLLDLLGDRIINVLRAGFTTPLPKHVASRDEDNLPDDMIETLREIDRRTASPREADKPPEA